MIRMPLRYTLGVCPFCGCKEIARDKTSELICTNCGNVIERDESSSVNKFNIAQILKEKGKQTFEQLKTLTNSSQSSLFGTLSSMESMGFINKQGEIYSLTKQGKRWYRQRQGAKWGY